MTEVSEALLGSTVSILNKFVEQGRVQLNEIPNAVETIYTALERMAVGEREPVPLMTNGSAVFPVGGEPKTKAEIRASIGKDFLTSFEDGKRYKMLKRHLTNLGMTLDDYRAKWGLPADYPAVAPSYSARRSELAKANGLGRK